MSNEISNEVKHYLSINQVINMTEGRLDRIRSGELSPILSSSIKENKVIEGLYPGDQMIIAGRTGSGKTSEIIQRIRDYVNWEINKNWKERVLILYDSLEMPDWRGYLRILSAELGVTVKELTSYQKQMAIEQYNKVKSIGEIFKNKPIKFLSRRKITPNEWYNIKMDVHKQYPNHLKINILDHTRLMNSAESKSERDLIANLSYNGVILKNEIECINIFISQLNRQVETSVSRNDIGKSLPTSSDIYGSDSVFQDADVVLTLHRPGMYNLNEFTIPGTDKTYNVLNKYGKEDLLIKSVLKQRDGWTGHLIYRHNLKHNQILDG